MKNSYTFLFVSMVMIMNVVQADDVLWSCDLTELPAMWTQSGFTFDSTGAGTYLHSFGLPPRLVLRSQSSWLETDFEVGSSEYDSLVIHVSQYTYIYRTSCSSAYVLLELEVNGINTELWKRYIDTRTLGSVTLIDSIPIHEVMTDFSNGDLLRFRFSAYANAYEEFAEAIVDWQLWDASLTAYGTLSFEQSTWAGIKAVMGCQFR